LSFFLSIYKKIILKNDFLIVQGAKDVDHLPFKMALKDVIF